MTLRIPAKVLLHVWSYDFYDMTLSTGKQRRHMIKKIIKIQPVHEKTNNLGSDQVKTQTSLYSHRKILEAGNFGIRK